MLTGEQWIEINRILLTIHSTGNLKQLKRRFLNALRTLVPYDQAAFKMVRDQQSIGLSGPGTMSYRDSDLLQDAVQSDGERYQTLPDGMAFGGGILITDWFEPIAEIRLLRAKSGRDFTDHELEVLQVFAEHLQARLTVGIPDEEAQEQIRQLQIARQLREKGLTEKETELALLVLRGYNNEQLAELQGIAVTTVKKHLTRIFEKMGVGGKPQLIYRIRKMEAKGIYKK